MKKLNFDILYAFILLILLIALKYSVLNLPYFWDGLNYMIPTIDYIYQNSITPFLWDYNLGHPPFFFIFTGILFKIFGDSPIVANSAILFFAFFTLFFTYLIGKELFNKKIGIIASLILFFTPMFFSYSALLILAMPLTALTIMTIYFVIKNKPLWYFIFGSLMILTETTGILVILAIILFKLLIEKKFNKDLLYYCLPILTFLLLIASNKIYYGNFFYPIGASLLQVNLIKNLFNFLLILKTIFFDQYRWILTSILLLSFINIKDLKKKNIKLLSLYLIISLLFFLFLYNLNIFTKFLINYYPNINDYFNIVKSFNLLFSILLLVLLLSYKRILEFVKNKKYLVLFIPFLFIILAHSFIIPFAPRYILFAFPMIYLFFAFAINNISKKYTYIIAILIILSFSLNFTGDRDDVGFTLETNMEYVDFIKTHQLAASYIEENFPDAVVLAGHPQSLELQYSYGKYVKKPIKVVAIEPFPGVSGYKKNYTEFLNPSKRQEIDISQIDLYYHSEQQYPVEPLKDLIKKLNLILIKRFEMNNKVTEIYLVNK